MGLATRINDFIDSKIPNGVVERRNDNTSAGYHYFISLKYGTSGWQKFEHTLLEKDIEAYLEFLGTLFEGGEDLRWCEEKVRVTQPDGFPGILVEFEIWFDGIVTINPMLFNFYFSGTRKLAEELQEIVRTGIQGNRGVCAVGEAEPISIRYVVPWGVKDGIVWLQRDVADLSCRTGGNEVYWEKIPTGKLTKRGIEVETKVWVAGIKVDGTPAGEYVERTING